MSIKSSDQAVVAACSIQHHGRLLDLIGRRNPACSHQAVALTLRLVVRGVLHKILINPSQLVLVEDRGSFFQILDGVLQGSHQAVKFPALSQYLIREVLVAFLGCQHARRVVGCLFGEEGT